MNSGVFWVGLRLSAFILDAPCIIY